MARMVRRRLASTAAITMLLIGVASPGLAQGVTQDTQQGDTQQGDTQQGDTQQGDTSGNTQQGDTQQGDTSGDTHQGNTQQSDSADDPEPVNLVDLSVGAVKVLDNVNILIALQYAAGTCSLDVNAAAVVVNQVATTGEATVCETRGQAVVINKV